MKSSSVIYFIFGILMLFSFSCEVEKTEDKPSPSPEQYTAAYSVTIDYKNLNVTNGPATCYTSFNGGAESQTYLDEGTGVKKSYNGTRTYYTSNPLPLRIELYLNQYCDNYRVVIDVEYNGLTYHTDYTFPKDDRGKTFYYDPEKK